MGKDWQEKCDIPSPSKLLPMPHRDANYFGFFEPWKNPDHGFSTSSLVWLWDPVNICTAAPLQNKYLSCILVHSPHVCVCIHNKYTRPVQLTKIRIVNMWKVMVRILPAGPNFDLLSWCSAWSLIVKGVFKILI